MWRQAATVFILFLQLVSIKGQVHTSSCGVDIMFYNVENLFDCQDDTLKWDEEFLPEGDKHWTPGRMYQKLKGISKVILASNGWNPPSIIGMCEIENAQVLKKLIYSTGLNNLGYRYVHVEGPDRRGVDVALLYRRQYFDCISYKSIGVSDTTINLLTRDVLYMCGTIPSGDTLNIFVCHWPSKRGGAMQSEHKRMHVAHRILQEVDSLKSYQNNAKIIVMGDFNAELSSDALQLLLQGENSALTCPYQQLSLLGKRIAGSHKYRGQWSQIDHILISEGVKASVDTCQFKIVDLPFLLEEDLTYSGVKPLRTYVGPRYVGGVSDHLPVMLRLTFKKEGSLMDSPYNP